MDPTVPHPNSLEHMVWSKASPPRTLPFLSRQVPCPSLFGSVFHAAIQAFPFFTMTTYHSRISWQDIPYPILTGAPLLPSAPGSSSEGVFTGEEGLLPLGPCTTLLSLMAAQRFTCTIPSPPCPSLQTLLFFFYFSKLQCDNAEMCDQSLGVIDHIQNRKIIKSEHWPHHYLKRVSPMSQGNLSPRFAFKTPRYPFLQWGPLHL